MRDWWIDELANAGVEHLDAERVDAYDAKAGFDPSDDIDALVSLGLGAGSMLVDLGAGTGTFALAAAQVGANVVAVDVSPAMTSAIERKVASTAAGGSVRVVRAGFLSYEHRGRQADVVLERCGFEILDRDVRRSVYATYTCRRR